MRYYILHIPSGSYVYNDVRKEDWWFAHKKIADQLVREDCPVNIYGYIKWFRKSNPQIDWDNLQLYELEVVEKE